MALDLLIQTLSNSLHREPRPLGFHDMTALRKYKAGTPEANMVAAYQNVEARYAHLVSGYISLIAEATRLEAENNFMVKIVNDKLNSES